MRRRGMVWALFGVLAASVSVACAGLLGIHELPADDGPDSAVADGSVVVPRDASILSDGGDASDPPDSGAVTALSPPSCGGGSSDAGGPGLSNCGPLRNESCCASPLVPGGTYYRSYDGVTNKDTTAPATVSSFRLDRFEATVGRFRKFVAASSAGFLPAEGSGKHTHLNGGQGLSQGSSNVQEPGWDSTWNLNLAKSQAVWTGNLSCDATYQTWTSAAAANEERPIVCETWFEAAAFCIWDGGFLPTEAEWNYAASGGDEQRAYPWSKNPPTSTNLDCGYANYPGCAGTTSKVGGLPQGDGRWGHADLGGDVWEWNTDWYQAYPTPCVDCASFAQTSSRVIRGGSFGSDTSYLLASRRNDLLPADGRGDVGFRCARTP